MFKHNCGDKTCNNKCNDFPSIAVAANQVYYNYRNLVHHKISPGENVASILEKLFKKIELQEKRIIELESKLN
jgi:hypothetical protein